MSISFSMLATATDPLLMAGPVIVAGFFGARYGQRMATRQLAHRTVLDQRSDKEQQGNSNWVLANIRRLFSLH
jgi:exonuclease I